MKDNLIYFLQKSQKELAGLADYTSCLIQIDRGKSWYRYIDFDKNSHEFAIAHKNTKQKGYIRVNSNYVKTALRIISLLGDNAIFIHFNNNDNSTLSIQSKSVCFEIAGACY